MSKKEKESRKKDFVSEAEELLEELTADIQQLEASVKKNNVRPELINKIFRAFHSMKGISGMLGFDRVSSFTHELENMLDKMRLGKVALTRGTIDFIFQFFRRSDTNDFGMIFTLPYWQWNSPES